MKIRPLGMVFHTDGYDESNNHFSQFCEPVWIYLSSHEKTADVGNDLRQEFGGQVLEPLTPFFQNWKHI